MRSRAAASTCPRIMAQHFDDGGEAGGSPAPTAAGSWGSCPLQQILRYLRTEATQIAGLERSDSDEQQMHDAHVGPQLEPEARVEVYE